MLYEVITLDRACHFFLCSGNWRVHISRNCSENRSTQCAALIRRNDLNRTVHHICTYLHDGWWFTGDTTRITSYNVCYTKLLRLIVYPALPFYPKGIAVIIAIHYPFKGTVVLAVLFVGGIAAFVTEYIGNASVGILTPHPGRGYNMGCRFKINFLLKAFFGKVGIEVFCCGVHNFAGARVDSTLLRITSYNVCYTKLLRLILSTPGKIMS